MVSSRRRTYGSVCWICVSCHQLINVAKTVRESFAERTRWSLVMMLDVELRVMRMMRMKK
jgi:hypothetical protein